MDRGPRPQPRRFRPLLVSLALLAAPAVARGGVPVGLYPLQADGLTDGERSEVQAVVESALMGADRRGVLEPRSPLLLPGTCKPPISVGCVATLAKGGVVLYAKAKRRGAQILVTVLFVDSAGRKTRAAAFPVDLFIQNMRPANDAIATVEAELAAGNLEDSAPAPAPARPPPAERPRVVERTPSPARPPPPAERLAPPPPPERVERVEKPEKPEKVEKPTVVESPPPPPPSPAAPPVEAAPAPPPTPPAVARVEPRPPPAPPVEAPPAPEPAASAPIDLTPSPRAEPARPPRVVPRPAEPEPAEAGAGGDWRRGAAAWCTGTGAAMLVAGVAVGLTGKRLESTLTDRYERGQLRPGDAKLYDRVDLYAKVANVLFVAGGVTTAAGLTFYAVAPSGGGAGIALAGTF